MRSFSLLLVAGLSLGCGSSNQPAKDPAPDDATGKAATPDASGSATPDAKEAAPKDEKVTVPTACANPGEKVCVMPEAFIKKLCNGFYPDLALYLFAPNSPWTRAYVNIKEADAWNSRSGPTSDAKLVYDEEVIILSEQKADLKGMSVSGAGSSYEFFRWDGTCASLQAAEMTLNKPPKPKTAPISWRTLEDATQAALQKDEKFAKMVADRRKECKGATIGTVSDKCEKIDKQLHEAIVTHVRNGIELPMPSKLP